MKRVVFFLQGKRVPAARFRGMAVAKELSACGIDVDLRTPAPSVYGDLGSWAGRIPGLRAALSPLAAVARVFQLRDLRSDDFIFFQRPMVELPTALFEQWAARGRRSLFDFDDAIYLNKMTSRKFRRILDAVDWIVAGNRTLAEFVGLPQRTRVIPTAVDTNLWHQQGTRDCKDAEVVVGWTGLSCNYRELAIAASAIGRALDETKARFVVISDAPPPSSLHALRPEFVRWNAATEVADLSRIDIGVMPLVDGPYQRGKCAFKLIQYMALGRPGLASPVGANQEVVTNGHDGYLPCKDSEWTDHLVSLIRQPSLRHAVGSRARERVVAAYSLRAVVPLYLELLRPVR